MELCQLRKQASGCWVLQSEWACITEDFMCQTKEGGQPGGPGKKWSVVCVLSLSTLPVSHTHTNTPTRRGQRGHWLLRAV